MAAAENGALPPAGYGDGSEIGRLHSAHCPEEWRLCVQRAPKLSRGAAELCGPADRWQAIRRPDDGRKQSVSAPIKAGMIRLWTRKSPY